MDFTVTIKMVSFYLHEFVFYLVDSETRSWSLNTFLRFKDQLQRGVDLALAIFHVNIVACTTELLAHILPQLLYVEVQMYTLMEPQLSALAYLTTFCLYTAWDLVAEVFISLCLFNRFTGGFLTGKRRRTSNENGEIRQRGTAKSRNASQKTGRFLAAVIGGVR